MFVIEVSCEGVPQIREISGMQILEQAKQAQKVTQDWVLYFANLASFFGYPPDPASVAHAVKRFANQRALFEQENLNLVQENNNLKDSMRALRDTLIAILNEA